MARRALTAAQLACVQAVRRELSALVGEGCGRVVVGLSGGADSLALTAAAAHCAPALGIEVEAVVVDHGLQAGSDELARTVAARARALGVVGRVERVEVSPGADGLEAAAREARLAVLTAAGVPVLLGHSLDDQAETVLLGLARGSGAASLQAMATRRGPFVRPLLGLRRAIVREACDDWGLEPWQDPMNEELRFRRVAVRRRLLPLMEEVLGGGVVEALGRTAGLLRADNELLDELAATGLEACRAADELVVTPLAGLPDALRRRVLRAWLVERGVREPTMAHTLAVDELLTAWRGQRGVDLPGHLTVRRHRGCLSTQPTDAS